MMYNISLRTITACLISFGLLATSYSQTATRNYITIYAPKVPRSDEMSVPALPKDSCIKTVQYFDGLGRPDQTIQVALSPLGKDIIQPIEYDQYGRDSIKYLPYRGSNSNGNYVTTDLTEQRNYYLGQFPTPDNSYPFAITVFENSPLNRIMKQGAPGSAWQPSQHPTQYTYSTNITNDVRLWTVNANSSISTSGFYLPGKLYKTVIKDENWTTSSGNLNTTEEYKDLQGNVVLKRSYVKENTTVTPVETYYVYDDFGLLRYVLPPLAVKNRSTATLDTLIPLVKDLCYYYQYDSRKRMIIKQLPGAGQVHLVYDKRDRIIASQDANQRAASKWLVTKYDHLNRPVMTALKYFSPSESRESLQTFLDNFQGTMYESRIQGGIGYNLSSFNPKLSLTETDLLTITYYDTYQISDTLKFYENDTVRVSNYYNSITNKYYSEQTRSLITGTRVKVLNDNEHTTGLFTWLSTTIYYDDKYRPIQKLRDLKSSNSYDREIISTLYDFVGKPKKVCTRQIFRGKVNTVTETYFYDHADRLVQIKHKLNKGTDQILASMEYNDLGQLRRKALHGQIGAGIQDLNYAYNIRGWLDSINSPSVNPIASSTKKLNLGLYYNNVPAGMPASAQYNGNISSLVWNTPVATQPLDTAFFPAYKKGYAFFYDNLNRLTASVYRENKDFAKGKGANNERYAYDLNGNILSLSRYLKGTGKIDSLTYTYKNSNISNHLDKVADASGTNGFVNGTNTTSDYSYDGNGNLTADLNKGYTSILYNYLNLPKQIGTTTEKIKYIYDASGMKLAKVSKNNDTNYYAGNFVYQGSSLGYIINEEGHVEPTGAAYKYYLKDHLGSVRMVVNTTGTGGTIEQQTDYYPFGMTIAEYNGSVIDYRYNGKELQDDLINGKKLDLYDYGARFYDAQIGRWTTIDPSAEEMKDMSPYNYCGNNPVSRMDPDGRKYLNDNDKRISEQSISSLDNENGRLDKSNQRLQKHIDSGKLNEDRTKKAEAKITENKKLIKENEASIKAFTTMGDEKVETIFTFKAVSVPHDPNRWESQTTIVSHPYLTIIDGQKVNVLEYSSTSNRVHEARHGLQILQGRLNLGRVENGRRYFSPNDIAETEAYRAEYASCGSLSLPNVTVESIDDINPSMWKDAKDNKGNTVYQ